MSGCWESSDTKHTHGIILFGMHAVLIWHCNVGVVNLESEKLAALQLAANDEILTNNNNAFIFPT